MCEPPVIPLGLNLDSMLGDATCFAMNDRFRLEKQSSFKSEESVTSRDAKRPKMPGGHHRNHSCRFQLEQDVHRLERLLQEELELRSVLENAVDHAAGALDDSSNLPHEAKELLSTIVILEDTVSRLEEEVVALNCQLIQERNERRLAEYQLKQMPSHSMFPCSPEITKISDVVDYGVPDRDKKTFEEVFQHTVSQKIKNDAPIKNLWYHPNRLSEEMVRCMKNILISLAESSDINFKPSFSESPVSSASPYGPLSSSSLWSFSESPSAIYSRSPQIELQFNNELLTTESSFDPYKVRGKLSWVDIGTYSLAIEVSWMSVGKKQLEYASTALKRFRSLVEQLAKVNPILLSGNEKLAFWINIYNALMMHAYLAYGVPKNDFKLYSLMQKAAYTVGGHSFNAAVIEYAVLKMKPPVYRPQTALLLALRKHKVSEVQRKFSVETSEPLVAFALSNGMYSSPAVRIYCPENIQEELQEAQRDYIRASVGLSSKGKLLVPKMLHCFARGFVDDSGVALWISRFLPPQQAALIEQCISQRKQSFLSSRACAVLPYDSQFRYLFLPELLP